MFGGQNFNNMGGTLGGPQEDRHATGYSFHMIIDNLTRLLITNLIAILSMVPAGIGFSLGALWNLPLLLLLSGVVGGAIAGPFYGALYDACLQSYRGFPGRWFERYRKVLRREWKRCLLPGIVLGLVAALSINVLDNVQSGNAIPMGMFASVLVIWIVASAVYLYLWPQLILLDLSLRNILTNARLMAMMHPAVTFAAIGLQTIYWIFMFILYPYSGIFMMILGVWFPAFFGIQIIYDKLDQELQLEKRLMEKLEEDGE